MAETTTISRQAPYLEAAGEKFIDLTSQLTAQPIDTSKFAPTIAGQNVLTQAAQQQAATQAGLGTLTFDPTTGAVTGVGTGTGVAGYQPYLQAAAAYSGPQAYQQFMSPYQQEVVQTTLSEFDKQAALQRQGIGQAAIRAGAFGGGREGVQLAEYDVGSAQKRAGLQAQLMQQGFQQAQQAALQQLQAQQGLGAYQTQLGQAGQAQQQAVLDAAAQAAREAQYEPFTRLGLVGQQLAQIQPGAFPTQTVGYQQPAPTPSPLGTAIGAASGIAGIMGKLGIFG